MKYQFSWQQVAVLAVLLGSVLLANLFAPGAVSAITSIVSTIVGALFVNLKDGGPPKPPTGGTPALTVLAGGATLLVVLAMACGPTLTPAEAADLAQHAATLAKCRAEGKDAGSYAAYEACKQDAGLAEAGAR